MSRLMMVTLQDFTSDWISFMMGITSSQIGPTFHVKTGKREQAISELPLASFSK